VCVCMSCLFFFSLIKPRRENMLIPWDNTNVRLFGFLYSCFLFLLRFCFFRFINRKKNKLERERERGLYKNFIFINDRKISMLLKTTVIIWCRGVMKCWINMLRCTRTEFNRWSWRFNRVQLTTKIEAISLPRQQRLCNTVEERIVIVMNCELKFLHLHVSLNLYLVHR
jgi:hypothetical protein